MLRTFVHHGMGSDVVAQIGSWPTGHGLLGLLIDEPRPLRLRDIAAHPASYGFPEHHPAMTSFLGVPVRTRERVFGYLYLTDKRAGRTSPRSTTRSPWHWRPPRASRSRTPPSTRRPSDARPG